MEVNSIYYYNMENHKVLKNGPKSKKKLYYHLKEENTQNTKYHQK